MLRPPDPTRPWLPMPDRRPQQQRTTPPQGGHQRRIRLEFPLERGWIEDPLCDLIDSSAGDHRRGAGRGSEAAAGKGYGPGPSFWSASLSCSSRSGKLGGAKHTSPGLCAAPWPLAIQLTEPQAATPARLLKRRPGALGQQSTRPGQPRKLRPSGRNPEAGFRGLGF